MVTSWMRCNVFLASGLSLWLVAIAPIGKVGKGIAYIASLSMLTRTIQLSGHLIDSESRRKAYKAIDKELEQIQLALDRQQQKNALYEIYGFQSTYTPEVKEELQESLEHKYREDEQSSLVSTSTSTNKQIYLAIKALVEVGKSTTFIVEEILQMKGRSFEQGKQRLTEILKEGEDQGW